MRGDPRPSAALVDFRGLVGVVLADLYKSDPQYVALTKRIWELRDRLTDGRKGVIVGVRWHKNPE